MSLSIAIPCRDDPRLEDCIRSIPVGLPVEILVCLNGSPAHFRKHLEETFPDRLRLEELPDAHLARALEHAIQKAEHDHVLLMDSDCLFAPGAIESMLTAISRGSSENEVYKGLVEFDPGRTWSSALVARSRTRRQGSGLNAYKPPLVVSRKIAKRIGGYFFDGRLLWKEDADLDHRIRAAGIRIVSVESCRIKHAPLTLWSDLRSSFCYGVGKAIAKAHEIPLKASDRSHRQAYQEDGLMGLAYSLALMVSHSAGQVYEAMRRKALS